MDERQTLLRSIPAADVLLRAPSLEAAARAHGGAAVLGAVRAELDALRASVLRGEARAIPPRPDLCAAALQRLRTGQTMRLRHVVNATGVALHTNLGRAPLADAACTAVQEAASNYTNLEYTLETGARGSRTAAVEELLCALCGCEAAFVVNNNAAAVLLALAVLSRGKGAAVSRGELVEIGDGFRLRDILEESGARVVEVGATNRTHTDDYERAARENDLAVLFKAHTSNFRMVGFTQSVSLRELARISARYGLATVADLGGGALLDEAAYPFSGEPSISRALRDGADIVCFSGDKLLGGPQAGILLGRAKLIERMRLHPLARALRIDKLSLAALEATLRLYCDPARAGNEIPALRMLCTAPETLRARAVYLNKLIEQEGANCATEIISVKRPVGGGCAPSALLDGFAVAVLPAALHVETLEARLRAAAPLPVVARISQGRLLLDTATIRDDECPAVAAAVKAGCVL